MQQRVCRAGFCRATLFKYEGGDAHGQPSQELQLEREPVRCTYHSGSILLQLVVEAHNALFSVILSAPEFLCCIIGGIIMDEPVIKTGDDVLEGPT